MSRRVAAQQTVARMNIQGVYDYGESGTFYRRAGTRQQFGTTLLRTLFPCKDGWVTVILAGGPLGHGVQRLVNWIADERMAPEWLTAIDWPNYDARFARQEEVDRIADVLDTFFRTKTKAEGVASFDSFAGAVSHYAA